MPRVFHFEDNGAVVTMEDAYRILAALGPMPAEALAPMADYGLSDSNIGRYHGLPSCTITDLRKHWGIDGDP